MGGATRVLLVQEADAQLETLLMVVAAGRVTRVVEPGAEERDIAGFAVVRSDEGTTFCLSSVLGF